MDPCNLLGQKVKVKIDSEKGQTWSSAVAEEITKTGIKLRSEKEGQITVLARQLGSLLRTNDAWIPVIENELTRTYDGTNPEVLGAHGITTHGCTLQNPLKTTHNWYDSL